MSRRISSSNMNVLVSLPRQKRPLNPLDAEGQSLALFQQVKGFIVGKIESGEWPPETRIPSESELIKLMSVSRMTVHRALRELAVDGYLVRHPGVGTFVSVPRTQSALFTIRPISEEISRRGAAHTAELQLLAEEPATREVAAALGLQPDVPVYHSVIVHMADGLPVELEDRYVNPAVAPDFLCKDFTRTTPSHYLFQVGPLTKAEHIFQAVMPDLRIRTLLRMEEAEPCLLLNRRTWIHEHVASMVHLYHPGTRFKIGGIFVPTSSLDPLVG